MRNRRIMWDRWFIECQPVFIIRQVVYETLKSLEAVKEKFSTIIVDTADIAYDYATKYICANAKRTDGGM